MKKDTKRKIVEAAKAVFGNYGFKRTSLADIAEQARMSRSALYHYFEDKLDLFHAVLNLELEEISRRTSKALSSVSGSSDRLRAYIHTRMQAVLELGNYYSAMVDEYFEHMGFIEKYRKRAIEDETNILQSILDEGVKQGEFSIRDTELAAIGISMALKGLEFPWVIRKGKARIKKDLDILIDLLFWGIKKR